MQDVTKRKSCWSDPKMRQACIVDAVAIAIFSGFAGGFFGLLLGLHLGA